MSMNRNLSQSGRIYSVVSWKILCLIFAGILIETFPCTNGTLVCDEGKLPCRDNSACYSPDDACDNIPFCSDLSDEENCAKSCSDDEIYCEPDDECYAIAYKCDGERDCSDGSDEANCSSVTCGLEGEFMCVSDKTCIVGSLRCDGSVHCHDGSDEHDCDEAQAESSRCESENSFDCLNDGSECIPSSKFCDGHDDCKNGEDESDPGCSINSTSGCAVNNGGCAHECIATVHGHHCECREGYRLDYDHKSCHDIDECENHACSHDCENYEGGYECTCRKGYRLAENHYTCFVDGQEPELWATNGSTLVQLKLHSLGRKITSLGGSLHAFTYGYKSGKIFWIDSLKKVIYWSNKDADSPPEILIDTMKDNPIALAYDWVHKNLYWADAGRHVKIEVVTLEHKWRTVILNPPEVDHPKALVVDPRPDEGYIYWAQGGQEPVIKRAGLDGSEPQIIVSVDIASVHTLALDLVEERLFWVDGKLNTLQSLSLSLESNDRDVVTTFVEYPKVPLGVGVFEDYVYWADAESKSVYKTFKFSSEEERTITTVLDQLISPRAIEVYHEFKQPEEDGYCGDNNGGCSHICLPSPHFIKFHCVCPMAIGKSDRFIPDPDNASSCVLLDSLSPSTHRPKNLTFATATALPIAARSSSASMRSPTNFIFKTLMSTYLPPTTDGWEPRFNTADGQGKGKDEKSGENKDNLWLYIGVGGTVGILIVLLLSFIGYKLYARHVAKNLHFDNPVFEQKPLRNSDKQSDSRA